MRIKIYQINSDRDNNKVKFFGYDSLQKLQGSTDIDSGIYKNVFYGDVDGDDLEDIYAIFNMDRVPTLQGHNLSVSDVVEVIDCDNEMFKGKCFFCDSIGYKTIDFDTSKCEEMSGLKCVYITPHHTSIELNLEVNEYKVLRDAVKGTIEITRPFDDDIAIVGNDEAKLIGMEGNRRVGNGIYAGPMLIVGDNGGEDFVALSQEQVDRYMERFAQPEEISQEETESDVGFVIYGFN